MSQSTRPNTLKRYSQLSFSTHLLIKGLKPSLSSDEEAELLVTLTEIDKLVMEKIPSKGNYSVFCQKGSFHQNDQPLTFYSFTPAALAPSITTQADIINMAVIYIPGNLETVAGQYRNQFLPMLCHDLQNDLQAAYQRIRDDKKVAVRLTLFMMDYYGRSSNKFKESNYTQTSLDTDAENIAHLTRHIVQECGYSAQHMLLIGHSLGGQVALQVKNKLNQDKDKLYERLKIFLDRTYGTVPIVGDKFNPELIAGGYMLSPEEVDSIIETSPGIIVLNSPQDTLMRRSSLTDKLNKTANPETLKGRLWKSFYNGNRRNSLLRTHQAFFQQLTLGFPWLTPIELMSALLSETPISPAQSNPRTYFSKKLGDFKNILHKKYECIVEAWIQEQKFAKDSTEEIEFKGLAKAKFSERIKLRLQLYTAYKNGNFLAEKSRLEKEMQKDGLTTLTFDCDFIETQAAEVKNGEGDEFLSLQIKRYGDLLHKLSPYFSELTDYEELAKKLLAENWDSIFKSRVVGFESPEAKTLIAEATRCATHYTTLQQNIQDFNEKIKQLAPEPTKPAETVSTVSLFKPRSASVTYHFGSHHAAAEGFRQYSLESKQEPDIVKIHASKTRRKSALI